MREEGATQATPKGRPVSLELESEKLTCRVPSRPGDG